MSGTRHVLIRERGGTGRAVGRIPANFARRGKGGVLIGTHR